MLLWGHVPDGSQNAAIQGQSIRGQRPFLAVGRFVCLLRVQARDAEIQNDGQAILSDQDVVRFEVCLAKSYIPVENL